MEHLDSGTLHAYLDNQLGRGAGPGRQEIEAHLAQCAACRASLEEAGRLRDRARGILSQSGPQQVAAPPFSEVLARAARQRTRHPNRPWVVLAWAASLVLAVSVGWYARSLGSKRAPENPAANVLATGIEARPPAAQQVAQAVPPRADTVAPESPMGTGAGASPSTVVAAPNRPVADVALAESKGAVDSAAPKLAEAPKPEPAPTLAPAPPAIEAPAMRRAAPREAQLTFAQSWVTVSPADAARRLGGPLAMIPGLPSLGTSVSGTGAAVEVRTILVLGPGQTIELIQRPAVARERAAAPAAAQPQAGAALRDEATGSVTVQWEGFSVSGRALVPQDSLRKLLQRLTAAEPIR